MNDKRLRDRVRQSQTGSFLELLREVRKLKAENRALRQHCRVLADELAQKTAQRNLFLAKLNNL